ncbi:PAS domain-containing protein [Nostoc sp.]|uniref:PAS domain-containing protein n=1 Tax=Nostoc sp. TaxID=1180 RepID=UPI002FFBB736
MSIERESAEAALRQSENLYRQLVESQTDIIIRIDLQGQITFANVAACQTFGWKQDEFHGQSYFQFLHPDDLTQVMESITASGSSSHPLTNYERCELTVNGIRWFQWNAIAIHNDKGEVVEIQQVGRDITEQQAALLDIATDAILVRDFQSQILFWNKGAERMYGWLSTEVIGKDRPPRYFIPSRNSAAIERTVKMRN